MQNIWIVRIAVCILIMYVLVGFFAPLIASQYPYQLKSSEGTYYPAFRHFMEARGIRSWPEKHNAEFKQSLRNTTDASWVPFDPNYIDLSNTLAQKPGSKASDTGYIHVLGTDLQGKDVMSGIIHGAFNSLKVSFIGSFIALLLALLLAIPSAYFGNQSIRLSGLAYVLLGLTIFFLYLVFFVQTSWAGLSVFMAVAKMLVLLTLLIGSIYVFSSWTFVQKGRRYTLPLDALMMRFLEFYKSVPMILVLLVLIAVLPKQRMLGLAIIIGFLIWPSFYRYIRASIFEQKQDDYYQALVNLGYSHIRIMVIHFLPKVFRVIMIPLIVSLISIILFEATLSFLGIGVEEGVVSWGKIIADARSNFSAWWLAFFPGMSIFLLIVSLNIVGDYGLQKLD